MHLGSNDENEDEDEDAASKKHKSNGKNDKKGRKQVYLLIEFRHVEEKDKTVVYD